VSFRGLVRGRIDWPRLEETVRAVAARYDESAARVDFLNTDNWLSTPCVLNERWFVKLISPQNALVHALITTGWNPGAFASGTPGFFEHCETPVEMARREYDATQRTREIDVNAPEPFDAFETNGLGVLVLEYLLDFRALDGVSDDRVRALAPELFASLSRLHAEGLCHGDLQPGNVLVVDGEIYVIDATSVRAEAVESARAYDWPVRSPYWPPGSALARRPVRHGSSTAQRNCSTHGPSSIS
jgi:serine/threonine protein kinase